MKISKLFLTAALAIAFISCSNNDDADQGLENDIRSVSVTLSGLSEKGLKASNPGDIVVTNTKTVNSVLINLTDASGVVIKSKLIMKDAIINSEWDKLTDPAKGLKFINTPKAVAKVYVYGNPKTAITTASANVASTTLADQQGSEVLYSGSTSSLTVVDEPMVQDPTIGKTYIATVEIKPIVSRIQIKKISFKTVGSMNYTKTTAGVTSTANVTWTNFSGKLRGLYLNSIYYQYNNFAPLDVFLKNVTANDIIKEGSWLFNPASPASAVEASSFASYNKWNPALATPAYEDMVLNPSALTPSPLCYAFNIFPGTAVPSLHIDLADLTGTYNSSDLNVYDPANMTSAYGARFINIDKFFKSGATTPMVAADFLPGHIYNMEIELIPALDTDLKNVQYNVMVYVTIAPWVEETITPGFNNQ